MSTAEGNHSLAFGYGVVAVEDFECVIRDGVTGKVIQFVATEEERARFGKSELPFDVWMMILAARFGQ